MTQQAKNTMEDLLKWLLGLSLAVNGYFTAKVNDKLDRIDQKMGTNREEQVETRTIVNIHDAQIKDIQRCIRHLD